MTFKKAEMAKTLENGLSMIEMNPLNHNWSHFMILLGLTLHQFQKKLLLSVRLQYITVIWSRQVIVMTGHVSQACCVIGRKSLENVHLLIINVYRHY